MSPAQTTPVTVSLAGGGIVVGELFIRTIGMLRLSGVYGIVHRASGKIYVGSSCSLKSRTSYHRSKLRNNKHDNCYLQNAWTSHGEEAFDFVILERCERDQLVTKEAAWMKFTGCCNRDKGFNLDLQCIRKQHSEETKRKIGDAHKGMRHTDEARAKMSAANTGRKFPPRTAEQRANHARASTGRIVSAETRAKMSAIHKGKIMTERHKQQIRDYWKRRRELGITRKNEHLFPCP